MDNKKVCCLVSVQPHSLHTDTLWEYTKYLYFGQLIDWLAAQITEQCMWRMGADSITGFKALLTRGLINLLINLFMVPGPETDYRHLCSEGDRPYGCCHHLEILDFWNALFSDSLRVHPVGSRQEIHPEYPAPSHLSFPWFEYDSRNLLAVTLNNHSPNHYLVSFWNNNSKSLTSNPLFRVWSQCNIILQSPLYSIILYVPLLNPDSFF